MNKKIAIIKPKLNLVQLNAIQQLQKFTLTDALHKDLDFHNMKAYKYLQQTIKLLYKNKLIKDKNIIINYISNFYPIQLTFSADCQINILKMQQLQSLLLQNDFELKIIV